MPEKSNKTKRAGKKPEPKKEKKAKLLKYFEATGRRKRAVARVRLQAVLPKRTSSFIVNNKDYKEYFPTPILQQVVESPFTKLNLENNFNCSVRVGGGGISGQAEAVRHGISRALTLSNESFRKKLKKAGFLRRDPREKERRKFGLKKARRAPQWSKR